MTEANTPEFQIDWSKTVLVFLAACSSWIRFRRACAFIEKLTQQNKCQLDPKLCRILQSFIRQVNRQVFSRQKPRHLFPCHQIIDRYRRRISRHFGWDSQTLAKRIAEFEKWWDEQTTYSVNASDETIFFVTPPRHNVS